MVVAVILIGSKARESKCEDDRTAAARENNIISVLVFFEEMRVVFVHCGSCVSCSITIHRLSESGGVHEKCDAVAGDKYRARFDLRRRRRTRASQSRRFQRLSPLAPSKIYLIVHQRFLVRDNGRG